MGKSIMSFLKKHSMKLCILCVVVILVVLVLNRKKLVEAFSGEEDACYFFHVDWCGYCKKAKPEWEKLYNSSNNGVLEFNGKQVKLVSVDCEANDENKELAKKFNVDGYPKIVAVKNGEKHEHNGERTEEGIKSFLSELHS